MYRAVGAEFDETNKCFLKKFGELLWVHFAGRHRELAMLYLTEPRYVTSDRDIIRRIGEYHLSLFRPEKFGIAVFVQGIAAQQDVAAHAPEIAWARDSRRR